MKTGCRPGFNGETVSGIMEDMNTKEYRSGDPLPGFPASALIRWYLKNRRRLPWRETKDLYRIWVSEVMLQQTQVSTVIPYYNRFISAFPSLRELADAQLENILKAWEGLGYYSRARNLQRAARIIIEHHGGIIPSDPDKLNELPGIGPYICAALLSIGFGQPVPVVDGNVMRVYSRFFNSPDDIALNKTKRSIFTNLSEIIPVNDPGNFNQALMELGALICTPKTPDCPVCPLKTGCKAREKGNQTDFPVRSRGKKPPTYRIALAILVQGDSFYIQRRPPEGHLGGLWEFPGGKVNVKETMTEAVIRECHEELGHDLGGFRELVKIKHQYTHFKIDVTVFTCSLDQRIHPVTNVPYRWIRFEDIPAYPFPRANHKIFPALKSFLDSR